MGERDGFAANLLGALSLAVHDEVETSTEGKGLPASVTAALVQLLNYPGQHMDDLAAATGLSQSGTVRVVDRLVRDGLAVRAKSNRDARQVLLHLTSEGSRVARNIAGSRLRSLSKMTNLLDQDDQAHLVRIATIILAGHTRDLSHAFKICRLCDESICTPAICPVEGSLSEHQ